MFKELLKHKLAYSILLLGLLMFTFYFFAVWPNRVYQRTLILGFSLFYFLWGIMVHVKSKSINKRVVMEYLAVSLLIGSLLFLITL